MNLIFDISYTPTQYINLITTALTHTAGTTQSYYYHPLFHDKEFHITYMQFGFNFNS